jgi:hypothetical protein
MVTELSTTTKRKKQMNVRVCSYDDKTFGRRPSLFLLGEIAGMSRLYFSFCMQDGSRTLCYKEEYHDAWGFSYAYNHKNVSKILTSTNLVGWKYAQLFTDILRNHI